MRHSVLTPVFAASRISLHLMFFALTALPVIHALLAATPNQWWTLWLGIGVLVVYVCGAVALGARMRPLAYTWLAVLSGLWIALMIAESSAAYLVFPLFFLYLHVLERRAAVICVVASTAATVVVVGIGSGWTVGGVAGPIVGAAVAVMIGWGYQMLINESKQREDLIEELVATRDRLAASERQAGALEERSRLAREIHDTIAQGLSSIQMLLYAAERSDPGRPGIEHVTLARTVAADNLAEARRFIRELSPAALEGHDLGGALRRLAETEWSDRDLRVTVEEHGDAAMSMDVQTAFLRIAQGAIANVRQHAKASEASIHLTHDAAQMSLVVSDNGVGFDPDADDQGGRRPDSFGLTAVRERVAQLGGALDVASAPGRGTRISVVLLREDAS